MNMLEKIQSQLEHLSKSERKVAEVILASPDNAIHSSIAALALEANVSEPTVNRFCRSMDTRGFPDFKLHLAQSLANGTPYVNRNVNEDDSVESYTGKIFESAMATLDHVRHSLDKSAINRAVDLLTQAKKIAFFGLGSSAAVAHDAMNKFFRFNVPVVYSDDIVLQRMSCMNCSDGDVVVLISHTGRTKNLVELAQLARENDAMVIALTSAGTPLAREATLAITLDVPEDIVHSGKTWFVEAKLKQGIESAVQKKIVKLIKDSKLKVQAQIQGEEIRVTGKSRDDLQSVMALVRGGDLGQPFQFKNFRD